VVAAPSSDSLQPAIDRLAADGFLAYPTETVWGLGACADRAPAIERLMAWKGRGSDAPMAVLVASSAAAIELGCRFDPRALRLAEAFWPGPLTLVVACERDFAPGVARADSALGLRCSPHPLAHALAEASQRAGLGPLTATSLNRSGQPPAEDLAAARRALRGADAGDLAAPLLVASEGCDAGGPEPSSVVDCSGPEPKLLRVGAIDAVALEQCWSG